MMYTNLVSFSYKGVLQATDEYMYQASLISTIYKNLEPWVIKKSRVFSF